MELVNNSYWERKVLRVKIGYMRCKVQFKCWVLECGFKKGDILKLVYMYFFNGFFYLGE